MLHVLSRAHVLAAIAVSFAILSGCAKKEAEVEPVVSVQVAAGEAHLDLANRHPPTPSSFPVEQAVITPKITSTIKSFEVQRGSRVHKGELLAVLENADLDGRARPKQRRISAS